MQQKHNIRKTLHKAALGLWAAANPEEMWWTHRSFALSQTEISFNKCFFSETRKKIWTRFSLYFSSSTLSSLPSWRSLTAPGRSQRESQRLVDWDGACRSLTSPGASQDWRKRPWRGLCPYCGSLHTSCPAVRSSRLGMPTGTPDLPLRV